jgi:hypothetical protein
MPLLANARRVVLAGAEERDASLAAGLPILSKCVLSKRRALNSKRGSRHVLEV